MKRRPISWNTIAVLIARICDFLTALGVTMLLTRYLGPKMYGEYLWIVTMVMLFQPLVHFELDKIIIREISSGRKDASLLVGRMFGLKTIFVVMFFVIISFIAYVNPLTYIMKIAIILMGAGESFFQYWLGYVAIIRAYEQMEFESIVTVIFRITHFSLIFLVTLLSLPFLDLFFAIFLADTFLFLGATLLITKKILKFKISFEKATFLYLIKEAYPIAISSLFLIILLKLDILLIRVFTSPEETSFFHIPHTIILQLTILPSAIVTALLPVLSRLYQKNKLVFQKLIKLSEEMLFIFAVTLIVLLYWSKWEVISILAGTSFLTSVSNLVILIPNVLFVFLILLSTNILLAAGRQREILSSTLKTLILNLLLDLILVPFFASGGAAFSKLITYAFYWLSLTNKSDKLWKTASRLNLIIFYALNGLILAVFALLFNQLFLLENPIISLIVKTMIILTVEFIFLLIFKVSDLKAQIKLLK